MIWFLVVAQVFIQTTVSVGSLTVAPLPVAQHEITVEHEHK